MAKKRFWQGLILILSLVMALCIFGGCDGLNLDFSSTPSSGNHGSQDKDDENGGGGGHGSLEDYADYIQISDVVQLQSITDMSGKYVLTNDIDGGGIEIAMIGSVNDPFTGEFAGNGYKISNVKINAGNTATYVGLFAVNNGIIRGVKIEKLTIVHKHSSSSKFYKYIGGMVGRNNGTITGVEVVGQIQSSTTHSYGGTSYIYIGGITGYNYGTVSNCSFDGTISSYRGGTPGSDSIHHVGGIAGNNGRTISKCLTSGHISKDSGTNWGSRAVGGICGVNNDNVEFCLFVGSMSYSDANKVDAIGYKGTNATQTACYKAYDVTTTGGNVVTEEYLNSSSFYTDYLNWDDTVWDLTNLNYAEGLYPKLR